MCSGGKETGMLTAEDDTSFMALLRMVGTLYYQKHKAAFDANGPYDLFKQLPRGNAEEQHEAWLNAIREVFRW